jgi:hypothetical protein
MATINKNFVIKNGLEVDTKTLYVNAATRRVGIGSTIPTVDLDVVGKVRVQDGINTPNLIVGVTTAGTIGVSTLTATNVNVSVAATITTLQASSFTVTGNSTIGDASSDTVALNAQVTTNIIPSTTDISDFGSTTKRWRDIHIARTINSTTLVGLGLSVGVGTVTRINGTTLNYSGIATVGFLTATHLSVTGVSTFINGPVLIGSGTSTGTATQRLQVTGGGYVSGSVGIGITNPSSKLHVIGDVLIGSATSTGTASQPLQVTGGAYVSGNLGIGITNPTSRLHVVGDVLITGITTSTDFNSSSDIRLKENVKPIDNSLSKLSDLTGVSFVWKKTGSPSIGVIAQDVEKVFPELVGGFESKTVNYNGLIGVLIEAVKELSNEVNELKKKINN